MFEEKKKYLNSYLMQEKRIARFKELIIMNPENKAAYLEEIKKATNLRNSIEGKIRDIDDELLCELLFQKYIFRKTLDEIALTLNYSKRHIERLHIKALEKLNM